MRVYDIIWKKRHGEELTESEIRFLISGYVRGEIPDYQMSAWCMAVCFQGMTFEEATFLTLAMLDSGETIDLSAIPGVKVDKHSTGGVGDKTSLILLPLVAALDIPVAKMSGRGLGHTGGTLDKLEAIPGFTTTLSKERFLKQAREIGLVLAGQTGNLVPADKKLYSLRDVTATVESIPLIASSIVSKKLASGADAVVLDVKYGDGAFIQNYDQALQLAQMMMEIGNRSGRRFKAVLSSMNQPLGRAIGNSLEVLEAIETLKGEGPEDLTELCVKLGGMMVYLADAVEEPLTGEKRIEDVLRSGAGLNKFTQFVAAQGGNPGIVDKPALLPQAAVTQEIPAITEGWIERIACRELGQLAMELGAGRRRLDDPIRPEVGLILHVKNGDFVKKGDLLATVYAASVDDAKRVVSRLQRSYQISPTPVTIGPLIKTIF